ncbi:hypothetical protein ACIHEI_16710 [Kitasatospora sp. NPDC051984]|uniref:hypothetical protein n=1 Tax=Kitasatospora sp. NPDC051984 TaxID=3364059 RepID=UPI0037C5DB7E
MLSIGAGLTAVENLRTADCPARHPWCPGAAHPGSGTGTNVLSVCDKKEWHPWSASSTPSQACCPVPPTSVPRTGTRYADGSARTSPPTTRPSSTPTAAATSTTTCGSSKPGCANEYYDLFEAVEERAEANEYLWSSSEPKPAQLDHADARIIPWASTDNGEFLYWLAQPGQHPDQWTVMVNEARGPWWEHFDLTLTRFLARSLTGETRSEILSDLFPSDPHDFRPSGLFG